MFGSGDRGCAEVRGSYGTGVAILRVITAARLDSTPAVFRVLYAYGENRCPELNERMDASIERGEPLTTAACDELCRRYLAHEGAGCPPTAGGGEDRAPQELQAEIRRLHDRLTAAEEELGRDPLTGLANRRRLDAALTVLVEAAHATRRPLSIAVADIDRFKEINDGYGHAAGDGVLRLVAAVLSSRPDAVRIAARLGGDEFVLVMPDVPLDVAGRIADELRRGLARRRFRTRVTRRAVGTVSVSVGVAELRPDESGGDLLRRADAALYGAKRGGRNGVAMAGAAAEAPATPRRAR